MVGLDDLEVLFWPQGSCDHVQCRTSEPQEVSRELISTTAWLCWQPPFPGIPQSVWLEQAQSWAGHLQGGLSVSGEVTSLEMSHPGDITSWRDFSPHRSCRDREELPDTVWGMAALPHLALVVIHGKGICSCSSGCFFPCSLCCGLMVGWQLCVISVAAAASGLYQQHPRHRSLGSFLATIIAPSPGCTSRGVRGEGQGTCRSLGASCSKEEMPGQD